MKKKDFLLIFVSSLLIVFSFITLSKGLIKEENIKKDKEEENTISASEIINNFEQENEIISKSDFSFSFVSYLVKENEEVKTYILSTSDGSLMDFEKIIKKNKVADFWNKVYELLDLKYPKFITDSIKNQNGNIYYDIKENEMIIYFKDYIIEPKYEEEISVKVNYNEVDSYLNFKHKLDEEYENENGYMHDKDKKTIAFSFDDGPNNNYTFAIVDALKNNKASATFFMVGNKMNKNKDALLYVFNNNFEIGSHTYSHINLKENEIDKIKQELSNTNRIFHSITNSNLTLLRPPYGAYNSTLLNSLNYPFILWGVDTNDWRYHDPDYIANHILENAKDGSVVLMHDAYQATVEAVIKVLPELYVRGYQIVGVSELASLKGKSITPHNVYSYFK